ncbi:MAG: RNA-binding protein [Vampirovibrionales bacterium]|nr:RNA-binding protein [Vampirovibrionales bacterium]
MNAKLFVRNLSWSATEDDLYDLFGRCGNVVSAKIPLRREDSKPRGFAFVEMGSAQEAEQAIRQCNGTLLHGRDLVVDYQDENRPAGGGYGRSGFESASSGPNSKLFVRQVAYSVSEATLETLFAQTASVLSVKIPTDRDTGAPKGFAFVEMASADDAQRVMQSLNGTMLEGKSLSIDYQDPNRAKPRSFGSGNGDYGGGYSRSGGGGGYNRPRY